MDESDTGRLSITDLTRNCMDNFSNLMKLHSLEKCQIRMSKKVTQLENVTSIDPSLVDNLNKTQECMNKLEYYINEYLKIQTDAELKDLKCQQLSDKFQSMRFRFNKASKSIRTKIAFLKHKVYTQHLLEFFQETNLGKVSWIRSQLINNIKSVQIKNERQQIKGNINQNKN